VAADPSSKPLFKRYLQGQDIDRWNPEYSGLWLIAIQSSSNRDWPWSQSGDDAEAVFRRVYPAIHAHLYQFREALIIRQDQGDYWWELRSCAYWDHFERTKILYPDLCWRPSFCLDQCGSAHGDTSFSLPSEDLWVLAVLNTPIMWAWLWRNVIHGKDETLRLKNIYTEQIPIPAAIGADRQEVESAARRLILIAADRQSGIRAVLDWLRHEFGVEKASQKLQALDALGADDLIAEVKKARGRSKPLSVADVKRLKDEYAASVVPLRELASEAGRLEKRVSDLVNAAYGLTPAEVDLLWATAPPRTPQ
jgi:hypothetical protein